MKDLWRMEPPAPRDRAQDGITYMCTNSYVNIHDVVWTLNKHGSWKLVEVLL